jgi:hypothetical protein
MLLYAQTFLRCKNQIMQVLLKPGWPKKGLTSQRHPTGGGKFSLHEGEVVSPSDAMQLAIKSIGV